jgi:hypothetical protein
VTLDGETYYRIAGVDRMPPFLTSVASDTDLWMFVASRGGLTAGRRDADGALFPYETVDRLHDGHHHTGPVTLLRVRGRRGVPARGAGRAALWEPLSDRSAEDPRVERSLYKNVLGNRLVFEEVHHGLGLAFRYRWTGSDELGLVRTATLENRGAEAVEVELLDGLRNLLPWGAPLALYQQSSCLVDAYKRCDLDPDSGLGIFSLTTGITDQPEPLERLRANVAWSHGLDATAVSLSLDAVAAFRRGGPVPRADVLTGARGNHLVAASLALAPGERARWHVVADAGLDHVRLAALRARLRAGGDLGARIEASLDEAAGNLRRNVASADGLQLTGHAEASVHHLANVLYNNMRGGVFARDHDVPAADFADLVRTRDRALAARHRAALEALPAQLPVAELLRTVAGRNDPDLLRLAYEYLPLTFGRRHGDPSRPWNRFSIRLRDADGGPALRYEGNWRDIFQNWEALGASFPGFLPGMVARFVDASTADGFNPYRIERDGIDWEVLDPRDPWGHIGYWGDHQVVYLLRLLEATARAAPGTLEELLGREIFCYADVPYRIAPYAEIVADPRHTITFDHERAARIAERVAAGGTDGKLVRDRAGAVHHAGLLEKLLVPALAKLSNLVPDGGVWMNTQRPEWNDANNALVGHGVSMVTLFHLRRYLDFLARLLEPPGGADVPVAREVVGWFRRLHAALLGHRPPAADQDVDDRARRRLMDALGTAFSDYRAEFYARGFRGDRDVLPRSEVVAFCRTALEHLDHAVARNRREDGLYHAYNLLDFGPDGGGAGLRRLDEMLEGQVAALSSGVVGPAEAARLVEALFASRLYRPDQRSFMLYPETRLPAFLERNRVPDAPVREVPLLGALLEAGETSLLARDADGVDRFAGDLRSARDVGAVLDRLAGRERWRTMVERDRPAVLALFESVFRHHAFTGRSGRMYAYEGLGCVYWHMVAKLLLAVQEVAQRAEAEGQPGSVREALARAYHRIRAGLGFEKTAAEYGAFPMDPYSHTPPGGGAQQPGMTGQVKEEILTRLGELGVTVRDGLVGFRPRLLRRTELLREPAAFRHYGPDGAERSLEVPVGALAFSFCQVPVVYEATEQAWVRVTGRDGTGVTRPGEWLDAEASRALLARDGSIERVEVGVPGSHLLAP